MGSPLEERAMQAPMPPSKVKKLSGAYAVASWLRDRFIVFALAMLLPPAVRFRRLIRGVDIRARPTADEGHNARSGSLLHASRSCVEVGLEDHTRLIDVAQRGHGSEQAVAQRKEVDEPRGRHQPIIFEVLLIMLHLAAEQRLVVVLALGRRRKRQPQGLLHKGLGQL